MIKLDLHTALRLVRAIDQTKTDRITTMTLIETLNKIGIIGDAMSLTFVLFEGEDDVNPDCARHETTEYLLREFDKIECDNRDEPDHQRAHQLCIYGAKLFEAIDMHAVDPSDCEAIS